MPVGLKARRKLKKYLKFYKSYFRLSPPYNILIDGSFLEAVMVSKSFVSLEAPLQNYFQCELNLFTTACAIVEVKLLEEKFNLKHTRCIKLLGTLTLAPCKHENPIVSVFDCFQALYSQNGTTIERSYCIATKDRQLTRDALRQGGIPVIFVLGHNISMYEPSLKSLQIAKDKDRQKVATPAFRLEAIADIKKELRIVDEPEKKKKKKKKKEKRKRIEIESDTGSDNEDGTPKADGDVNAEKEKTPKSDEKKTRRPKKRRSRAKRTKYEPDINTLIRREFGSATTNDISADS